MRQQFASLPMVAQMLGLNLKQPGFDCRGAA
jgi:hypothetical protein